jgi:hypothetical protein
MSITQGSRSHHQRSTEKIKLPELPIFQSIIVKNDHSGA